MVDLECAVATGRVYVTDVSYNALLDSFNAQGLLFQPCKPTTLRKRSVVGEHHTQRSEFDLPMSGYALHRFSERLPVDIVPPHQLVNIDEVSPSRVCIWTRQKILSIGRRRFLSLRSLRGLLRLAKFLTTIR
jgi:hypothetical protein